MSDGDDDPIKELELICPCCQQPTTGLKKVAFFRYLVFVLFGATYELDHITGCSSCVRRRVWKRSFLMLIPANLLWPILVLPWTIALHAVVGRKGHSPELVQQIQREISEIQLNQSPLAARFGDGDGMISNSHGREWGPPPDIHWGRIMAIPAVLFAVFPLVGMVLAATGWIMGRKQPGMIRNINMILTLFGAIYLLLVIITFWK